MQEAEIIFQIVLRSLWNEVKNALTQAVAPPPAAPN